MARSASPPRSEIFTPPHVGAILRRMSKAFTKEADADDEAPGLETPALPAGTRNYITPAGFERMRVECQQLLRVERPRIVEIVSWAAGNGDRSENGDYLYGKRRLREIVDPAQQKNHEQIFFGATVTYENSRGEEHTVRIVGADESDMDQGKISWLAPLSRALLKKREGDVAEFETPAGRERVEVIGIRYEG
jgi:transcription elongation factor GreB